MNCSEILSKAISKRAQGDNYLLPKLKSTQLGKKDGNKVWVGLPTPNHTYESMQVHTQ